MTTDDAPTEPTKPVMGFTNESPEEAIAMAIGRASTCWESLSGTGVFQSTTAKRIVDELLAHLMPDEDLAAVGDWLTLTLNTGGPAPTTIYGELVAVFSGEGDTDGLLQVRIQGDQKPTNIYERHIVMLYRHPAPL